MTIKKMTMTLPVSVASLASAASLMTLLTGCGSGSHGGIEEPTLSRTRSMTIANGLQVTLGENNYATEVGHSILYTLTVTNTTNAPITYYTRFDCRPQLLPDVDSAVTVTNTATKVTVIVGNPEVTCASIGTEMEQVLAPGASISGSIESLPTSGAQALTSPGTYEASVTLGTSFARTTEPITVDGLLVTVTK